MALQRFHGTGHKVPTRAISIFQVWEGPGSLVSGSIGRVETREKVVSKSVDFPQVGGFLARHTRILGPPVLEPFFG